MNKLPILVRITWRSACNVVLHDNRLLLGYGKIATAQIGAIKICSKKNSKRIRTSKIKINWTFSLRSFRIPHLHTISSADLTGDTLFKPPSLFAFKLLSWSGLTRVVPITRYDGWRESGRLTDVDLTVSDDCKVPWFISNTGKHCCFGLPRGRVWGDCPEEIFSSSKIFNFWWYHEDRNSRSTRMNRLQYDMFLSGRCLHSAPTFSERSSSKVREFERMEPVRLASNYLRVQISIRNSRFTFFIRAFEEMEQIWKCG